ncbi:hypothetical protein [Paenibacillus sp. 7523-1]|uniref:hypothetical protein n=1 Tax=Paenibacillus sp. 7523-1 TaxID=2022550 RepID=UPI000BA7483E|nr:hypothetical protein [Paenibacillus sp. 7523-1]PAD30609.1 hypothetical protein CHH60_14815 [Paenibacillus sp. 7523-1]
MNTNLEEEMKVLYNLVDQHQTVSFDVYDTAVLRNVLYPIDIFEIVQRKISGEGIVFNNFKELRIKSEEAARIASSKEDISIDEIYLKLKTYVKNVDLEYIKKIELDTETEFTIANSMMKKIYNYALSKGKSLYFISDMYLPQTFIYELLVNLGYKDFKLFVSNEVEKCKGTGSLYHYIYEMGDIDKKSWLHIGDNYISDCKVAMNFGINTYYYKALRERNIVRGSYSIEYSIMKAIQINEVGTSGKIDYWEKFGIYTVSSIFWGFTNWLIRNVQKNDLDNLHFLSRDGYIPYKIYEKLRDVILDLPPGKYLHASRRVYQLPNILNMNRQDALDLLTAFNPALGQKITLDEIFNNIGLDIDKYSVLIYEYGFSSIKDEIKSEMQREKMKKLLDRLYPEVIRIFEREKEILIKYLNQNKVLDFEEINIVDIGWRGSTHKAIKDITGKKVVGYYLGTTDNVYADIKSNVEGYAFKLGKPREYQKTIMDNVMMFEFIFSAPQGSLIKLEDNEGIIIPRFKQEDKSQNHLVQIEKGIIKATDLYKKYYPYIKNIEVSECLNDYFEFINRKDYDDLMEFSHLSTSVGIGDTQDTQSFVTSVNLKHYVNHKRQFNLDAGKNLWKNALIVYGSVEDVKKGRIQVHFEVFYKFDWFIRERIIKGIRNPGKVYKYISRKLRKWSR